MLKHLTVATALLLAMPALAQTPPQPGQPSPDIRPGAHPPVKEQKVQQPTNPQTVGGGGTQAQAPHDVQAGQGNSAQ